MIAWGSLPARMTFAGTYRFASGSDLDTAIAAVEELLTGEDDETFAADLQLRRRTVEGQPELRVRVDTECPRDWYLAYEALIEALAEHAIAGEVVGELDDTLTTYGCGRAGVQLSAWLAPLAAWPSLDTLASTVS
jgi:hypothetical protein